jgi:hypothetical protein
MSAPHQRAITKIGESGRALDQLPSARSSRTYVLGKKPAPRQVQNQVGEPPYRDLDAVPARSARRISPGWCSGHQRRRSSGRASEATSSADVLADGQRVLGMNDQDVGS